MLCYERGNANSHDLPQVEPPERTCIKHRLGILTALLIVGLLWCMPAQAQQAAGEVERQKGTASRTAAGSTSDLAQGGRVFVGDEIRTGAGARLQIRFGDQSSLTLGENARITINRFVYKPDGDSNQGLAILKGVFRFSTGEIGKRTPGNIAFTTPVATVGIRGTVFVGGELTVGMPPGQPHYGFQITEGSIEVTSPGGSVVLDEPGEGTFLPLTRVAAPTPVRQWTPEEAAEAQDALAF